MKFIGLVLAVLFVIATSESLVVAQSPSPSSPPRQSQPAPSTPAVTADNLGPIIAISNTAAYVSAEAIGHPVVYIGSDATPYGIIGTFSNHPLGFRTNNVARLFIDTNGSVGIGTANPAYKLDVNGAINGTAVLINGVAVGAGGSQWASGASGVISYAGGNVGIGTTSPATRLHIANASAFDTGLSVEASEGDRAAMYYSPNTGVVFDSFRPGDGRRLPMLLQPNGGNVGIGTAGPGKLLHLSTSTNSGHLAIGGANQNALMFVNAANSTTNGFLVGRSYSSDDANTFFIYDLTTNTNRLLIDASGNVGIGTTTPTQGRLHVEAVSGTAIYGQSPRFLGSYAGYFDGNVVVTGQVLQNSDVRLKQGIRNLSYGLHDLMQLRPVSFTWKQQPDGRVQLGLLAQEVEALVPELVTTGKDADQTKSINYIGLVPVLVKAIQEQQDTITALDARIRALDQALERSREQR